VDPISAAFTGLTLSQLTADLRTTPRSAFDPRHFRALLNATFYRLRAEMGHNYRPGSAPPCRLFELHVSAVDYEIELYCRLYDDRRLRVPLTPNVDGRHLDHVGFVRICQLFWDRQAEAFERDYRLSFDWRDDVELRNRIEDASRGLPPRPAIYDAPVFSGIDMAADESCTIVQRVSLLTGASEQVAMTATQVRAMETEIWRGIPDAIYHGDDRREAKRRDAEARGLKLLKEWLSPAQLAQFEQQGYFDVTAGDSGKHYRIHNGTVQNVYELDAQGEQICGWCFAPAGGLVAGDVMLAQKVALETDERGALLVANRFDDWRGIAPGGFYGRSPGMVYIDEMAQIDLRPVR
jgi:hypothetical protein